MRFYGKILVPILVSQVVLTGCKSGSSPAASSRSISAVPASVSASQSSPGKAASSHFETLDPGQLFTGDSSTSLYYRGLDMTSYTNWNDMPVLELNSDTLQNLFRLQWTNPALPQIQVNTWNGMSGLATAFPNAAIVLSPGPFRFYDGAPWYPASRISVQAGDGKVLNYWGTQTDGAIIPYADLDVWASDGTKWGLVSTGAMKDLGDPTAAIPGLGTWPEESRFPGILPLFPNTMTFPQSLGVEVSMPGQARQTDNWNNFGIPNLSSLGYVPQACNFWSEVSLDAARHVKFNLAPVKNTMSGLYKVDLAGDLGVRWVLVYTNVNSMKTGGYAEYFGLDMGPGDQAPSTGSYGQVFYGQEYFGTNGVRINWSAGFWNKVTKRTASIHIQNCQGGDGSVSVTLGAPITDSGIQAEYQRILQRPASESDVAFWLGAQAQGWTVDQMDQNLMNSDEYRTLQIKIVFQSVLNRSATSGEVTFWLGAMQQGWTPAQIEQNLMTWDESRARQIESTYYVALARWPSPTEIDFWEGAMKQGWTINQVQLYLMATDEYKTRQIESTYYTALARWPSNAEIQYWLGAMKQGWTADQIQQYLTNSDENHTRQIESTYYVTISRWPTQPEIDFWLGAMKQGWTLDQIKQYILAHK